MKKGNSSVEPFKTTSLHIVDGNSYNAGDAETKSTIPFVLPPMHILKLLRRFFGKVQIFGQLIV